MMRMLKPLKAKKPRIVCSFCKSGTHRLIRRYAMNICGQCFYLNATSFGWRLGGNK